MPNWKGRFRNMDFRRYFGQLIRKETPAWIVPVICWIGPAQMTAFETAYCNWLALAGDTPDSYLRSEALNELIEVLSTLRSEFETGTLHDCEDGNDENPIILDNTSLGTLNFSENE